MTWRGRMSVAVVLACGISAPATAFADPAPDPGGRVVTQAEVDAAAKAVEDTQAEVAAVQKRLDDAREQQQAAQDAAEIAAEKANGARALLAEKTRAAATARQTAAAAAAEAEASQGDVEHMAAQLYMRGGSLSEFAWLFAKSTGDMARAEADITAAQDYRQGRLEDARDAQARAAAAAAAAVAAQKAQQQAATQAATALTDAQDAAKKAADISTQIAAQEKQLVARLAELRRTSVQVEQRRQTQLREAAEAAEAARIRAQVGAAGSVGSSSSATGVSPANLPAPNSKAAGTAISFAKAQLGKPYLWGGTGPGAFDCSGLTLGAWTSAGGRLPRTAQWQYTATARVAIADLQPGDLVFFGPNDRAIHHVGLYVGNGTMIEAPHTGAVIRYSSIYRRSLLPTGGRVG